MAKPHRAAESTARVPTKCAPTVGERPARLKLSDSEALRRRVAAIAQRARHAAGYTSHEQLALQLDCPVWVVKHQESRAKQAEVRLSQLLIDRVFGLHVTRAVAAEIGAHVVQLPDVAALPLRERDAALTSEAADVIKCVAETGADDVLEPHELRAREKELVELIDRAHAELAACRKAMKG